MLAIVVMASCLASTYGEWARTAGEYRMQHPAWPRTAKTAQTHNGENVEYYVNGGTYEGYISMPQSVPGRKGEGVLIAHQWMGLGDYEKSRADEMAAQGYIAFALDVYGKGIRCKTESCARAAMDKAMADIPKLLELISAGTRELLQAGANSSKLVALGYCFGGSIVLELARHPSVGASRGVRYVAVSSVHGVLAPLSAAAAKGEVTARVQVHHAELDYQGDGALVSLEAELKKGVNGTVGLWETIKYAKCEHGWTEPDSAVYRARAAVQAHKSSFEFFEMALGDEDPDANPYPVMPFCRQSTSPSPAPPTASAQEFVFSAEYLNSTRQWGKCLHLLVKYKYLPGEYLDYKPLRQEAIDLLLAPTEALPVK